MNTDKAVAYIKANLTKGLNVIIGPAGIDYEELQYSLVEGAPETSPFLSTHLEHLYKTNTALLDLLLKEVSKLFEDQGLFGDPKWDPDEETVSFKGFWGEECFLDEEEDYVIHSAVDAMTSVISPTYRPDIVQIHDLGDGFNPIYMPKLVNALADWAVCTDKTVIATTHNPAVLEGLNIRNRDKLFLVRRLKDEDKREIDAHLARTPRFLGDKPTGSLGQAWMRGYLCE